jgi:Carboxypeptidase regulatory-like domain
MRVGVRVALAVCLLAGAGAAGAQEITGNITGTVTDQTAAVLPGVTVSVKNAGTSLTKDVVTNDKGTYTASYLPPGRYDVTFSLSGFQTSVAHNVNLHVNDRVDVSRVLATGGLTETVEVSAAAEMVQPTPQVQSLMGDTQVQELPLNNRNFMQLATLVPGVSSSLGDEVGVGLTSDTSISINGARRNGVNWLVDGASNVDVGSNITLLSTPTLESIEEFKIITSSYAAEWPRSGGGIINVVTKSGTNDFRASAYEFFRNDHLNANNFFRKQNSNPDIADHPAHLRYNNFGYTLGGPVKKDKLFFFWSQEWRRIVRAPNIATATVPSQAWLNDPTNANYVPPAERDPNAVALLAAWPAPNVGANGFTASQPVPQNTRQEVIRADYLIGPKWRLMARYTHDLSQTDEFGGLFVSLAVPNVGTTHTEVPGQVFVTQLTTTISANTLNEFSYQLSGNDITTTNPDGTRSKRSDYGLNIGELFPENNSQSIPFIRVAGLATLGANQLFSIHYRDHTVSDNLSFQRGNHSLKVGALVSFEQKNENAANTSQGDFTFVAGGGFTSFQNFLRGNRGGACGSGCLYTEAQVDVTEHLRWNRYEAYAQDSWKVRPGLTLDFGLRYSLFPPVTDKNNLLDSFVPGLYSAANAPRFSDATGSVLVAGTGNPLNGIIVAGQNSPYGRKISSTDKNNFGPRLGFSFDPKKDGKMIVRGGYGIYYDEPLIGIFEQNSFTNPPYVSTVTLLNPSLSNPASGTSPTTRAVPALIASSDPFTTPRTMQWNVGVQRQLYARGAIDVSYVGSHGDHLIAPVSLNQPQPQDVVRLNSLNLARPYLGYGNITMRQTSARQNYAGLLVNFRHDAGRAGLLQLAYTLSRNMTDASNDRDAVDLPQNPLDLGAEYALARTDRTHVFNANYVYELPFFKSGGGFLKTVLGGWQISGITTFQTGLPISRVVNGQTNGSRRGIRVNQTGDPFANLPANVPGGVYWFNPAAFAPPADGTYGTTGRAIFRLPGRNQWDVTLSKNFYPTTKTRVQFRADLINAFNHTQFDPAGIQNVCTVAVTATSCAASTAQFGQITLARNPREIELGVKFGWQ